MAVTVWKVEYHHLARRGGPSSSFHWLSSHKSYEFKMINIRAATCKTICVTRVFFSLKKKKFTLEGGEAETILFVESQPPAEETNEARLWNFS